MQYLARTLIYLRDKHEAIDPETGDLIELEVGYIQPGQIIPIEVGAERAEIWLSLGHVVEFPEAPESPTLDNLPHEIEE